MEYKYTFLVKDFKSKVRKEIKLFKEILDNKAINRELGLIFDMDNVKMVSLNKVEKINELGKVLEKIDFKKW